MIQNIVVIGDQEMIESIGVWMMMNELTQVAEKSGEVQIKKMKLEVPDIMKVKVEAPKAMIKILGNMNQKMCPGVQEGQIMCHTQAEAQDNQINEVQSKTFDHQIQNQDGISEEIP